MTFKYSARLAMLCILGISLAGCGGGGDTAVDATRKVLASVHLADGNDQTATVGTQLPQAVVAQLLNAFGEPIAGQVVNFHVAAGGGSVFAGAAASDADGFVRELWTMGTIAGPQRLEVRAINAQGVGVVFAAFDAIAVAGPPTVVAIVGGDGQEAQQLQALPVPVRVNVLDTYGNRVTGAMVSFTTTTGSASPVAVATDATGAAAASWTLGLPIGTQTLAAAVNGTPGVAFYANATQAPPGPAVDFQMVSGNSQTMPQHTTVPNPLMVKVLDALGNGVPGVAVDFAAAPGSGYIKPRSVVTDAGGIAAWNGYVHAVGAQQVRASTAGLPAVTFSVQVLASGNPFDGVYPLSFELLQFPGMVLPYGALLLTGDTTIALGRSQQPHVGAFSEPTGSLFSIVIAGLSLRTFVRGTLIMDANGRVTGGGTVEESFMAGPFVVTGTWTTERE